MIVSANEADLNRRPDVLERCYFNGQHYGLQLSDFTGAVPEAAKYFGVFRPTVLTSTPVVVPTKWAGLTVENVGNGDGNSTPPWSFGIEYGIHRLLGFGTYWPEIETSDGVFDWSKMDAAVSQAVANGKDVMWNVAYTPWFHSSNLEAHRSAGYAATKGWAAAPSDLTATMQVYPALNSAKWSRFARAAVRRYVGRIKYYVMWNEPNYRMWNSSIQPQAPVFNWKDTSDTGPTDLTTPRTSSLGDVQRYDQHVRLLADLYGIVQEEDPAAIVLGPDFYGEAGSQATGGKQSGRDAFANWLASGGANYCHGYAWHGYMDEGDGDERGNIDGVSRRLVPVLQSLEAARVAAGAPAKPWYNTETGHNVLEHMPMEDQRRWVGRHMIIAAALGWKSWVMYVWDSQNPATTQMSLWAPATIANPGVRAVAGAFSQFAALLQGSTITYATILSDGRVCATINGTAYVV